MRRREYRFGAEYAQRAPGDELATSSPEGAPQAKSVLSGFAFGF
jgi:hypothetical protein